MPGWPELFVHAPLDRAGLWRRVGPFALILLLAFVLAPVGDVESWWETVAAAALLLATGAAMRWVPWPRLPRVAQTVPPLAVFAVVALLRESHGGSGSGYAPLVLLPVLWFALYGTRSEVLVTVVGVAVTLGAPLVADAGGYGAGEWRRAAFYVVLSFVIGLTLNRLVRSLVEEIEARRLAEATVSRLRAHEVNDDVVQGLAIAKLGLELGRPQEAKAAIDSALTAAQRVVEELVDGAELSAPGSLVRGRPPLA
jgi:hypothetical protein